MTIATQILDGRNTHSAVLYPAHDGARGLEPVCPTIRLANQEPTPLEGRHVTCSRILAGCCIALTIAQAVLRRSAVQNAANFFLVLGTQHDCSGGDDVIRTLRRHLRAHNCTRQAGLLACGGDADRGAVLHGVLDAG